MKPHQSELDEIVRDFRERRFDAAADKAEAVMRAAAKTDQDELLAVSRFLAQDFKLEPIFASDRETVGADALPLRVVRVAEELFGADHLQVTAARNRLAATYASQGKAQMSADLWEQSLAHMVRALPADHPAIQLARNSLAILYNNLGKADLVQAVYAGQDVCEHLRPVKDYIVANGGKITFAGAAWSDNCRTWIYFDGVILDPPALKRRFNLPDCVEPHEYVDIKAGNEQGLICNVHHDGLMGPHPSARTLKIVG